MQQLLKNLWNVIKTAVEKRVEKVDPAAKVKPAAKAAIDAALKAQKSKQLMQNLIQRKKKEAAKEEAMLKQKQPKQPSIKQLNADVTAAKEAGVGTITPVGTKSRSKTSCKTSDWDAYTAKVAEIEKRPELTTEERSSQSRST